ncbi:GNAT family N-acetyltransferase [Numidum massiliense]|uniref:GNAT family N-acetyltransferase n=1 Tax=Numidum massiliense TaxID=1522315 RepID=UPI0009EBFDB9|nr:GNAT family protein [Numidum massiliense]
MSIKYIEGKKVYLRPYEPEQDRETLYQAMFVQESNLFTGTTRPFSRKQIAQHLERIATGDESRVDFVIVRQMDDKAVGEVVLNDIERRNANIRIALFDHANFNKGYGTEALRLMLDFGFGMLQLHRIELGVYDHNTRGIYVYEKLGFTKEGVLREHLFYNHRYYDLIIMSMLEDEYRQLYLKNGENT